MPRGHRTNRTMFWRIVRRLLGANRGRLFVILLALGAGAAVTAALLNLQVDAKRRLTSEFRAFGPNVIVTPQDAAGSDAVAKTLDESLVQQVPTINEGNEVVSAGFLYVIVDAVVTLEPAVVLKDSPNAVPVVLVGHTGDTDEGNATQPPGPADGLASCNLGARVASQLNAREGSTLLLRRGLAERSCYVRRVVPYGGQEDAQIFVHLDTAQRFAETPGRISLIKIVVPGTPDSIGRYIAALAQHIPDADVRPIRQFTEAEAKIYNRISGLLTATVAVVLILTALCVMAAMTNVAMERKNDVGLMKAIGGATRRVMRLFLAEAAVLGLVGGALGAAAGILLSIWLGQAVFGVAARPRLIVYPVAVALTIIVAIAGAYPLRRLASVRPAFVFRGEA
jgi:ABC-type lipoprotein release transport system permease subunit